MPLLNIWSDKTTTICIIWDVLAEEKWRRKQPAHCSRGELIQFNLCYNFIHSLAMENEVFLELSLFPGDNSNMTMLFSCYLYRSDLFSTSSRVILQLSKVVWKLPGTSCWSLASITNQVQFVLSFFKISQSCPGLYLLWHKTMRIYTVPFWDKRKELKMSVRQMPEWQEQYLAVEQIKPSICF